MIERVISGFQTGVDQGAITAASLAGIPTGGWIANGWLTEDGAMKRRAEELGLKECPIAGWAARTEMNVRDSDGTLILNPFKSPQGGTYTTLCCCESMEKPRLVLNGFVGSRQEITKFMRWLDENPEVRLLNVAGPRESKWPGIQERAFVWMLEALGELSDRQVMNDHG